MFIEVKESAIFPVPVDFRAAEGIKIVQTRTKRAQNCVLLYNLPK